MSTDPDVAGSRMYALATRLYPICRSITGQGVRDTLAILKEALPRLDVRSVRSGTPVNDWTVPDEWNVREAFVADLSGRRVIDFRDHNLHLVNYSIPVRTRITKEELLSRIHTIPDQPGLIPYRTSYYRPTWGFCLQHERLSDLTDAEYDVVIDATLEPGELNYAELFVEGTSEREILFSTHICHPSLANDNLSGIALVAALAANLDARESLRYSYRFVFVPGTIGAITWLASNPDVAKRTDAALVVALVGAPGPMHYKQSPAGDERIDRVVKRVLRESGVAHEIRPFTPYGYDERQYTSPGYRIPAGSLTRIPHGEFPEYHTSGDDLDFIQPRALAESLQAYLGIVEALETERLYVNLAPYGEPQLGKRGLYGDLGGAPASAESRMAMLWVLHQSDGRHSLRDIAERSGIDIDTIDRAARTLLKAGLLDPV